MSKPFNFIETLINKRIACNCSGSSNHITACLKNNNIISIGVNDEYRHSEVDAILKLKFLRHKLKKPVKLEILVIKVSSTRQLGLSKPCIHCLIALSSIPKTGYIITDIYYSNENGDIIKTTLKTLLNEEHHISYGNRN